MILNCEPQQRCPEQPAASVSFQKIGAFHLRDDTCSYQHGELSTEQLRAQRLFLRLESDDSFFQTRFLSKAEDSRWGRAAESRPQLGREFLPVNNEDASRQKWLMLSAEYCPILKKASVDFDWYLPRRVITKSNNWDSWMQLKTKLFPVLMAVYLNRITLRGWTHFSTQTNDILPQIDMLLLLKSTFDVENI